jgi:hypothetical protein
MSIREEMIPSFIVMAKASALHDVCDTLVYGTSCRSSYYGRETVDKRLRDAYNETYDKVLEIVND